MLIDSFNDAALLLMGHGSTVNGDSGATVYQHAAELRRRGIFAAVREAFFKIEPRIGPVLAGIRAPRVFAVPFFAADGYFTRQAIPSGLGLPASLCRRHFPPTAFDLGERRLFYCEPVGTHPMMTGIVLQRAAAALSGSPFGLQDPRYPTALIIAGHGTDRNANSRKSIERQVRAIAARHCFAEVRPAFIEEDPRISEIPNLVISPRVVVVPFFMSDGLHVCEDIPVMLGADPATVRQALAAGQWPWLNPTQCNGRQFFYTPSVGSHPDVADVILERVRAAALAGNAVVDGACASSHPEAPG